MLKKRSSKEEVKELASSNSNFSSAATKAESDTPLKIGETIIINEKFNLKRVGQEEYSCSCPSWKVQGKYRGKFKTCKHVDEYIDTLESKANPDGKKRDTKADAKLEKKNSKAEVEEEKKGPQAGQKIKVTGKQKIKINLMLAEVYDPEKTDPTGWYMSEKLDGVRAYWSGCNFYSRNGNLFYAPKYVKDV